MSKVGPETKLVDSMLAQSKKLGISPMVLAMELVTTAGEIARATIEHDPTTEDLEKELVNLLGACITKERNIRRYPRKSDQP